jgi:predicted nucleic acid-binding protein
MTTLVDSNVMIDIATENPNWLEWSAAALEAAAHRGTVAINPIVFAEVSAGYNRIEEVEDVLPAESFLRLPLPWEAAFLAGQCFVRYRNAGGSRRSPLPDFYIGAHAAVAGLALLTRDGSRYRSYFPKLKLVCPS